MSTLNGKPLTRCELRIPRYGQWQADVDVDTTATLAGRVTLIVGDLQLVGDVVPGRAGFDAPARFRAIVKGGLAWDTLLTMTTARPARSYQSDSPNGVRLKSILLDLAIDCGGVSLELPADVRIGAAFSRLASTPSAPLRGVDVLAALVARGRILPWWVDLAGVTRFTTRTGPAVTAAARVLARDLGAGMRLLGVDSASAFLPGGTFEGVTIGKTIIRETKGELRVEVWES
jgi:hypothetical protein